MSNVNTIFPPNSFFLLLSLPLSIASPASIPKLPTVTGPATRTLVHLILKSTSVLYISLPHNLDFKTIVKLYQSTSRTSFISCPPLSCLLPLVLIMVQDDTSCSSSLLSGLSTFSSKCTSSKYCFPVNFYVE